jgi:hypothetical protein
MKNGAQARERARRGTQIVALRRVKKNADTASRFNIDLAGHLGEIGNLMIPE